MEVGPNVNWVDNSVPDGCTVEQVAYVVRHGSRFPDTGAYGQWTTLYAKVCASIWCSVDSVLTGGRSKILLLQLENRWLSWRAGSQFLRTLLRKLPNRAQRDGRRRSIWGTD